RAHHPTGNEDMLGHKDFRERTSVTGKIDSNRFLGRPKWAAEPRFLAGNAKPLFRGGNLLSPAPFFRVKLQSRFPSWPLPAHGVSGLLPCPPSASSSP